MALDHKAPSSSSRGGFYETNVPLLRRPKGLKSDQRQSAGRLLLIVAASVLMALNIKSFVNAGGLFPGGFNGLTLLIQRSAAQFAGIDLPFSPINLLLNAIPAILSFRLIGKWFTTYSCLMIALTSVLTDLIPPLTPHQRRLAGVHLRRHHPGAGHQPVPHGTRHQRAGTDFIAAAISERLKTDAWNYVFGFNCVMLTVAGFLFGWDKALYSIIFQYASTQVVHLLDPRFKRTTLFIISNSSTQIFRHIKTTTHHSATLFRGHRALQRRGAGSHLLGHR